MKLKCLKPKKGYFVFRLSDVIENNRWITNQCEEQSMDVEVVFCSLSYLRDKCKSLAERFHADEEKMKLFEELMPEKHTPEYHTHFYRMRGEGMNELELEQEMKRYGEENAKREFDFVCEYEPYCLFMLPDRGSVEEIQRKWYPRYLYDFNPEFVVESREVYLKILPRLREIYQECSKDLMGIRQNAFNGMYDKHLASPDAWDATGVPRDFVVPRGIAFYEMIDKMSRCVMGTYETIIDLPVGTRGGFTGEVVEDGKTEGKVFVEVDEDFAEKEPDEPVVKIYCLEMNYDDDLSSRLTLSYDVLGYRALRTLDFRSMDFEEETKDMKTF